MSGLDWLAVETAVVQIGAVTAMVYRGNRGDYRGALGWACVALIVDAVAELAAWWGAS